MVRINLPLLAVKRSERKQTVGHIGHFTKRITFAMATATSVLYLAGCGSTPEPTSAPKIINTEPVAAPVEQHITPEHKLVEAKKVWLQTRDKVKRDTLLLDAVSLFLAQVDTIFTTTADT